MCANRLYTQELCYIGSEQIGIRQAQVDKMYAGLKDLTDDRRERLEESLKLYMLQREVDDLEQWIEERQVVAGSHELGQDYEHVTMLRDRFRDFARDTQTVGQERVTEVNDICNSLIQGAHTEAATIAQWKDQLNESWADLLELMDTRSQHLKASWNLHRFFHDCKETLDRILEKQSSIPDDLGRDVNSVDALQRRHATFENDLMTLGAQVAGVQEAAAQLISSYAGEKQEEIREREAEVVAAWRSLQELVGGRKDRLSDTHDLYRFFVLCLDLMLWMDDIILQIKTQEKPRDVCGVELLMNNHQSLRAEIDARDENFSICVTLGKDMIAADHYRIPEVKEKLSELQNRRALMMGQWEEKWVSLTLLLEVYQFAQDSDAAEAWLIAQDATLSNMEVGEDSDAAAVDSLLKKFDAFEKNASAQEDRFGALERLTQLEIRERQKAEPEEVAESPRDRTPTDYPTPEMTEAEVHQQPESTSSLEGTQSSDHPSATDVDVQQPPTPGPTDRPATPVSPAAGQHAAERPRVPAPQAPEGGRRPPSSQSASSKDASASMESGPPSVQLEGGVMRKLELDAGGSKASHRAWDKVFAVHSGGSLAFYKDQKHARSEPGAFFRGERPGSVEGARCEIPGDYSKRPNVLRIMLTSGAQYLVQCKHDEELTAWKNLFGGLSSPSGSAGPSTPTKAQTLPAKVSGKKEDKKKAKKSTMKRN